jgi:hypothetical protein
LQLVLEPLAITPKLLSRSTAEFRFRQLVLDVCQLLLEFGQLALGVCSLALGFFCLVFGVENVTCVSRDLRPQIVKLSRHDVLVANDEIQHTRHRPPTISSKHVLRRESATLQRQAQTASPRPRLPVHTGCRHHHKPRHKRPNEILVGDGEVSIVDDAHGTYL